MDVTCETEQGFRALPLVEPVLAALEDLGYETPTPIQSEVIPHVLTGGDVIGKAQTGTGKTAAFALPILSKLDLRSRKTQVLVLAPTRELALQVAGEFNAYGARMKGLNILSIYGGSDYGSQLRALKRGVQIVVGTPGRVMEHMRRGSLDLGDLQTLVLDEADEMLRMGFIDDVEWILSQTPAERQVALFSATMPQSIRAISRKHLTDPVEVDIKQATSTACTVSQRCLVVENYAKFDALTRVLEAEDMDGVLVFARTKNATNELVEKLEAQGYKAAALNGDLAQKQREHTVEQYKRGGFNILVATDVAARGLDVERISHVINYDVPYDTESYVHRIGRTGRAGRSGEAILFINQREKRQLRAIEHAIRHKIQYMNLPDEKAINEKRVAGFKNRITESLSAKDHAFFSKLIEEYRAEHEEVSMVDIAAALASLAQGGKPLLLPPAPKRTERAMRKGNRQEQRPPRGGLNGGRKDRGPDDGMERFRVEVGRDHGVRPGNLVGAITGEAGLDSEFIGRINIYEDFSTVDLPEGMPREVFSVLQKVWVSGRQLRLSKMNRPSRNGKRPVMGRRVNHGRSARRDVGKATH